MSDILQLAKKEAQKRHPAHPTQPEQQFRDNAIKQRAFIAGAVWAKDAEHLEGGGWIPVGERLPERGIDVLVAGPIHGSPETHGYWQRVLAHDGDRWVLDDEDPEPWTGYPPIAWKVLAEYAPNP